jgi:hypothetical protein
MPPRRSSYDPLAVSTEPRWLVVRNMHSAILEQKALRPGDDLRGAFAKALAAHVDDGWQLETFSSNLACGFCRRGDQRRVITIEAENPTRPSVVNRRM